MAEPQAGTLIVGASQAGLQLAVSLRALGDTEPITLVGAEAHPPYQRPPLSKTFLAGGVEPESLAFRTPAFYADAGIELVCGERVTDISLARERGRAAGVATTGSGRDLSFHRLALAVGGRPRRLHVPGNDLQGVTYLRDIDDATSFRSQLASAHDVVVVGGGFIGLEAAAAARSAGKAVTVVEAAERLMSRAVAPVVSEFYRRAHERRGTRVLLSAPVSGFVEGDGRVTGVHLSDGRTVSADLVLVGVGLVPRTELAERLGLECDGGIVVDAAARTSDPSIVAAGDCTVLPHPVTGEGRVRLESVQNAVAQARVAAASLLGASEKSRDVPWFWSDQYDLKLQIAGLSTGYDRHVMRGDPESEQFSVLYYRDGRLLAVDSVNRPVDYMAVRKTLSDGRTIDAVQAADLTVPLKNLIARPAQSG
jgi:3-phenylpropionate/trans-cinnamate dioxygenase ferredoxin reductase subunit